MARSSIADVWASLLLSADGITNQIKREAQDSGDLLANHIARGLRDGVMSGGTSIQNGLTTVAQNAQLDFAAIMTGVQIPTAQLNQQFSTIASNAGQALQGQVQQAVQQGFQQGSQNLPQFPTAPIQQPVQQATQSGATDGFKKAGPAILGAIAALGIGAAVAASISSGLDKEQGSANMQAALGLDPETAKRAGEVAGNLYVGAYGDSMEGVQAATSATLSSFKDLRNGSTKEIEEVTKRALNMAQVFELDVARSTQVASQMITTGWAQDATSAMDLLSASMQKVPANVREDIMDAVDEYGPFMRNLGLQGEKGLQLLVNASAKGMYGIDKLGDSLKEFEIRSTDMSDASGAGYEAIGLNQAEMSTALLSGGDTAAKAFSKIISGLRDIKDPLKQSQAALALFGTPLEDLSVTEIPTFLASLQTTAGGLGDVTQAAKDMDAAIGGTSAAALTTFKRTVEVTFADAIMPLVKELQPLLQQAGQWFKDNQDNIGSWIRTIFDGFKNVLVPAIETVLPVLQEMFTWLAENEQMLKDWVPVIIQVAAVLGALMIGWQVGSALVAMASAIKVVAVAFWGAATASTAFGISVGWLVLLGVAVFALGFIIGTTLSQIIGNFGAVWDTLKGFFTGIADNFGNLMNGSYDVLGVIGGAIMGIVSLVVNGVIAMINMVPYAVNALLMGVNGIFDLIPGFEGTDIPLMNPIPYMEWNIPALATGADIMGPTVALLGEKDPETVVNRGGMNQLIDNINDDWDSRNSEGDTIIVNVEHTGTESPEELAWKVARAIEKQRKR